MNLKEMSYHFKNLHLFIVLVTSPVMTLSDVRFYKYMVKDLSVSTKGSSRVLTSSLNPSAYTAYHGGDQLIKVELLDTWMCFGNTARKTPCESPSSLTVKANDLDMKSDQSEVNR